MKAVIYPSVSRKFKFFVAISIGILIAVIVLGELGII